ncbi:VanW family protein [Paenibacillus protaetiae]|uniref:G5 domain-containing protein n=1 Tax=Paenibacillus protaetiae TaxID=2509456 RepID=A0A4P6EXM7_9BACL|nr:VanW family protein [Paenibacillus protaetiae]QAY67802.1 hypothetical protein ET464_16800 [Paenibacillus protaetiae]
MKRLHIGLIVVLSLLLIAAAGWGVIWYYAQQNTVPEGVKAGGISLSGMDIDEAVHLLDQYEQTMKQRTVTVQANVTEESAKQWTAEQIGYKADYSKARAALLQLEEGSIWDRAKYRYHFQKDYPFEQSWDKDVFETAVKKEWGWVEQNEAKDATRTITDDDKVIYTPHTDAYRLNIEQLSTKVEPWLLSGAGAQPSSADQAIKVELPISAVHPKVTLDALKAEGIDRKIIEFTTDFSTSASGRAYNVTSTAEALDGWELGPDEVFDYAQVVKKTEEQYGYKEAPVILNGKLVPGIGGGICQVSSTLYNAVLRSGLEIVERRNHSLPVSYLPLGQDATFASGAIDFRFKNNTGKKLIIRTEVKDRKLTVKLFGTMPDNIRYDIESVTVQTIAPPVQQVGTTKLPAGVKQTVQQGKTGYIVETYRTLVQDGKTVSREKVSRDTYKAQPTIVNVGSASGSITPAAPKDSGEPLLEDGIG